MAPKRGELKPPEAERLVERLARRLDDRSVPTLPSVAMRVIQLVGDRDASLRDVAEAVQADEALTARILKLVNSAYFGQQRPVTSLHRATVLLGMDRLKALALGFHVANALPGDPNSELRKRVWTNSLYRASLAFALADRIDRRVSGEAFVVGLLSDVGEPLMPSLIGDAAAERLLAEPNPRRRYALEIGSLPLSHVDVAAALCRIWKLPDILTEAIRRHHDPPPNQIADERSVLLAITNAVGMIPLIQNSDAEAGSLRFETIERTLSLPRPDVEQALVRAGRDFEATMELFGDTVDDTVTAETLVNQAHAFLAGQTEALIANDLTRDSSSHHSERVEAGGLLYDIEPLSPVGVTVFITDSSGKRLISEQIDPRIIKPEELRATLLLDDANDHEVEAVMNSILRVAA